MRISRRTALAVTTASLGTVLLSACRNPDDAGQPSETSASPSPTPTPVQPPEMEVWPDNTTVPHLFFHSLVVDTARAFDGDPESAGYLDYMATVSEFEKIIQQLFDRDFVLVSPHEMYDVAPDGAVSSKPLEVPVGKRPVVLSFDDLSYYEYMEGDGFATDVAVTDDGALTTNYEDASGKTKQGNYDYVPILEEFVSEHPEFSPTGAKGLIAMTGYNGVLGYRTSELGYKDDNEDLEQDQKTATDVASAMKDKGWEFACHTWGHINCTQMPLEVIQEDMRKWKAEVEPIVGPTDLLIYPFGADIAGLEPYGNAKFDFLKAQGFHSYYNVDASTTAWNQYGPAYLRQARINVDGISLKAAVQGQNQTLFEFFDPHSVVDPARPATIAGS
ncbi:polysaccharide deacetylase [Kocuria coralli]|uniref:Polysaccharide deacetylase n=1 Tax=Kocuria coralli TaxID=1461025 RepID=A0A5J5KW91_9MICC|nr:polysaccharide deacetylase family protein [Kocuria coralli]KAA9393909.1 polysaccharide deacetylase [Kocuria coralli]